MKNSFGRRLARSNFKKFIRSKTSPTARLMAECIYILTGVVGGRGGNSPTPRGVAVVQFNQNNQLKPLDLVYEKIDNASNSRSLVKPFYGDLGGGTVAVTP